MMPPGRTVNEAYKERGVENVVKIDVFPLKNHKISVIFESVNSARRQGIWLKTNGGISVDGETYPSVTLWHDTAPCEVICHCFSTDKKLFVYNIWERDGKRSSLSHSSGMLVEDLSAGRRYHCNDIGFNEKFDKLVFSIIQ